MRFFKSKSSAAAKNAGDSLCKSKGEEAALPIYHAVDIRWGPESPLILKIAQQHGVEVDDSDWESVDLNPWSVVSQL